MMIPHPTPSKRRFTRWLTRIGGALALIFLAAIAFIPAPSDPILPLEAQGGGARQGNQSLSGLQIPFPDPPIVDAGQAALGRLLFYDPILSGDGDRSCATCHHPDLGFSDGLPVAVAADGSMSRRHTMSLWNVAFVQRLLWDGRAESLEQQALMAIASPAEMNSDPDALVARLSALADYVGLFSAAFPYETEPISPSTITAALAAFQRTLISDESPFDRFAAGDFNALTPAQRRGFAVFRSAQTRCFECHAWATFDRDSFHVLGVPDRDPADPDRGRVEVVNAPNAEGAFRVPGLRNVALSAPYMHNGSFATLEDVIAFYADGGGTPDGVITDEKIRGFSLSDQQLDDLVAFLHALTDEPPESLHIPPHVPSGLPVVSPIDNPARVVVEQTNAPPFSPDTRAPQTIRVHPGGSIQAAVDRALPGDTIEVFPGVYHETILIDTPNLTVRGIVQGDERPWIDGRGVLSDGFNTTGNDFTLEGFGIRRTIGNGVLTTGAQRIVYRDLILDDTGIYGLYPVECTDLLIERVVATRIADAAIYVGQSRGPIIVRDNIIHSSVTAIEIENSTYAEVYGNHVYDNAAGILVFVLPNTPSRVGYHTRIYDNLIEGNNRANFAAPNTVVASVPSGSGIIIMSADHTEVFNNTIRDNKTVGVLLMSLYMLFPGDTVFDIGVIPEYNWLHDNHYTNNGYDADPSIRAEGVSGADILWTGDGWTNSFDEPNATIIPPIVPSRSLPDPLRRALWRIITTAIELVL